MRWILNVSWSPPCLPQPQRTSLRDPRMLMSAVVTMLKIWPPLLCALSSSGKTQQERAGSPHARNAREMEEKRFWQHVGEWNLFQVHWGVKTISLFGSIPYLQLPIKINGAQ
jgi:hypothetical protein